MTSRTRTTITIHTRQRIIVRPLHETVVAACERCGVEALTATPDKAAEILDTTVAAIGELLIADQVHTSSSGLICCNSLAAAAAVYEIQIEGE
jgi:hypothetical protein